MAAVAAAHVERNGVSCGPHGAAPLHSRAPCAAACLLQNEYRGLAYVTIVIVALTLVYFGFQFLVDVLLVLRRGEGRGGGQGRAFRSSSTPCSCCGVWGAHGAHCIAANRLLA